MGYNGIKYPSFNLINAYSNPFSFNGTHSTRLVFFWYTPRKPPPTRFKKHLLTI